MASSFCLAVVLVATVVAPALARIESVSVDSDGRDRIHIESFGFEPGGEFQLEVSSFKITADVRRQPNPDDIYRMAFVLMHTSSESTPLGPEAMKGECLHESDLGEEDKVWMYDSTWETHVIFTRTINVGGYYHLFLSNCEEPELLVSFSGELTEYNKIDNMKNYLSAGEASLPVWLFLIACAFFAQLVVWLRILLKQRENVRNIHHLMTAVLVLKVFTVLFESFEYYSLRTTGKPHGWDVAFYTFAFVKGMLFFMVIVLIGTGWSYLKPFLTERDKQIMLVVLVVQLMVNIAMVVVNEANPGAAELDTTRDVLHLLDIICCCAILVPIVWSIRHLRETAEHDGKAARNMLRLRQFRKFYLLVVSFIYLTRIIVPLLQSGLSFDMSWVGNVFYELATLVFYTLTGVLFRPRQRNPYLSLPQEDV